MTESPFEDIYSTSFFNAYKLDDSIVIRLKKKNNLLISSWHNTGYNENLTHVVNQSLEGRDYADFSEGCFEEFQSRKIMKLGLDPDTSTGITTSACMDNYAVSTKRYEQLEVTSIVTAGADNNGIRAGDTASFYEYNNHYMNHYGTINIITLINSNLEAGGLVTALITITEAKTSVLEDLKLESKFSTNIATGTGTDGVCVISNKSSENHLENAGKHSKLGELIAKSVQEAVRNALFYETGMCTSYQKTVLSRLSRFNITFYDLFEASFVDDIAEYASMFYEFNNSSSNVAFVSSVINLVDEVKCGLLDVEDTRHMLECMFSSYLDFEKEDMKIECGEDILVVLVEAINSFIT